MTAFVRCGFRSWAMSPILYWPTGIRACSAVDVRVESGAGFKLQHVSAGFSVQTRANAASRCSTSASQHCCNMPHNDVSPVYREPDGAAQRGQPRLLGQRLLAQMTVGDVMTHGIERPLLREWRRVPSHPEIGAVFAGDAKFESALGLTAHASSLLRRRLAPGRQDGPVPETAVPATRRGNNRTCVRTPDSHP